MATCPIPTLVTDIEKRSWRWRLAITNTPVGSAAGLIVGAFQDRIAHLLSLQPLHSAVVSVSSDKNRVAARSLTREEAIDRLRLESIEGEEGLESVADEEGAVEPVATPEYPERDRFNYVDARIWILQSTYGAVGIDRQALVSAIARAVNDTEVRAYLESWVLRGCSLDEVRRENHWSQRTADAVRMRLRRAVLTPAVKSEVMRSVSFRLDGTVDGRALDRKTNPTVMFAGSATCLRDWFPWAPRSASFVPVATTPWPLALPVREIGLSDHASALRGCWPTFDESVHTGSVTQRNGEDAGPGRATPEAIAWLFRELRLRGYQDTAPTVSNLVDLPSPDAFIQRRSHELRLRYRMMPARAPQPPSRNRLYSPTRVFATVSPRYAIGYQA
jgi:hypothetical protein